MGGIIVIDFIDMDEAENRQKLYDRMRELMANDRARHNILPLSKFGLMQITRQRVRPALDIITSEDCPTCHGKGTIPPSLLFTDLLESKIHYLVYKLKIKKFTLHVHPFVAAYVNQGVFSLKMKWRCKYTFQLKVIPNQSLAYLEYKFYDAERNEIDLKEEIEIKKYLFSVIDSLHPGRNRSENFIRDCIEFFCDFGDGQLFSEYFNSVTRFTIYIGYIDHAYVHTNITYDGSSFSVYNDTPFSISQMAVESVGISYGNCRYAGIAR